MTQYTYPYEKALAIIEIVNNLPEDATIQISIVALEQYVECIKTVRTHAQTGIIGAINKMVMEHLFDDGTEFVPYPFE